MGFFDELEPEPEPPAPVEYRAPPWAGPPVNAVPATVALDVVLARTGDWAAWVGEASVTPAGMAFTVTVLARSAAADAERMALDRAGPDAPRFGVGFADGRKAVSGEHRTQERRPTGDAATEIVLWPRGGSGSRRRWSRTFWLWPLPADGPLTFAFAWPAEGVAETLVTVDGAPIRAAAARAIELWPDERPPLPERPDGPGWLAYS